MVTNKVKTYAIGFQNVLDPLKELSHEVVWAANFSDFIGDVNALPCQIINIPIQSSPIKQSNITAYKQLCSIIKDEKIDAVICSTPIGGFLGRLAAYKSNIKTIIYEAHGFLFFKGAPLINRTIYKLQEALMARITDVLININQEDYDAASNFKLRGLKKHYLVHGAGVPVGNIVNVNKNEKRLNLGLSADSFVVISAGFLNKNKNNRVVIDAIAKLNDKNIYYLICGDGELKHSLIEQVHQLGIEDNVKFMGYRTDIGELMAISDVFVMPSFREGVPRSLLEAMDLGLPCIGSKTRGIQELIGYNNERGILCDPKKPNDFAAAIEYIKSNPKVSKSMSMSAKACVKYYSSEVVRKELYDIFKDVLS